MLQRGEKKTYLRCHRFGNYSSSSTSRINSRGTCKIGRHCPATLEVLETDNEVKVTYFKTHVGHEIEIKYIKISKADKEDIRRKLAEGVPFQRILDDVRNSSSIKWLCLLTRKDLINIRNACDILKPERLHDDDSISVHLFTEKMKELGDASPVVFFKAQGCNNDSLDIDRSF